MTKEDHIDQDQSAKKDTAIFGDGGTLAKDEAHQDVEKGRKKGGMKKHGETGLLHGGGIL